MTAPLLLSVFPTFAVGGAQIRFTSLANHLGTAWRHAIVSMDGVTTARERLAPGLDLAFMPVEVRKGDLVGNVRRFRRLLREIAPATMLTHNFGSIEWAMANRLPLTRHIHVEDGFGPEERRTQLPRRVWLRRLCLRRRPIVLPSRTLMQIAREVWQIDPANLHYVPNGIDLARFPTPTLCDAWRGDGPVIGTVAALRPEKNVGRLIRAFHLTAMQAPARLVLVGDGPQRHELEALTIELGLSGRVHFAGHVSQPDAIISTFDIFAISSDTEQMPLSLLEAMAAGLPVAATNVGDIGPMLPEAGRAFVTSCSDAALAGALTALVKDAPLRRELGRLSRARVAQEFDQADMFRRWSTLLEPGRL